MIKPQIIQIAIAFLLVISLMLPIKSMGETNASVPSAPTPVPPTPDMPPGVPNPSVPQIPGLPNGSIPSLPPYAIAPVADAGPDKTVAVDWVVQFDASASYDPNGKSLNYSWYFNWTGSVPQLPQPSLPPITLPNVSAPKIPNVPEVPTPTIPSPVTPNITLPELPFSHQTTNESPELPDTPPISYPSPNYSIPAPDSGEQQPTHVYNTTGNFTVLLIVNNGLAMDSDTLSVTVLERINRPPTANAGSNQVVNAYDIVRFDGSKSTDPDNDTLNYFWDFGDNTTGEGIKTTHTYKEWRIYFVTLTVRDNEFSDSNMIKIIVREINVPPVAVAGVNQTVEVNDVVYFDGSNSYDRNNNPMYGQGIKSDYIIQSYVWDFGDGTKGYGVETKHIYTTPGTYRVELTVSDREFSITNAIYVTVKHLHSIGLSMESNNIQVLPGNVVTTKVAVTNVGTISENVSLSTESYFKDWLYLERNSTIVEVRQTSNVAVSVKVPSTAKAGTYDFTITSFVLNMSKKFSNPSTLLTISVIQESKISLSSDLSSLAMKPGERKTINVSVTNAGNDIESIFLDADGELKQYITLPKNPSFIIKENTTKTIQIELTAPSNVTQKRCDVEITAISESGEITSLKIPVDIKSVVKDENVPGFEIVYVIGIFFVSALILMRKKKIKVK